MTKLLKRLLCRIRGCRFNFGPFEVIDISRRKLYFCKCCGCELMGRTLSDLEPMSDEDLEWLHREIQAEN